MPLPYVRIQNEPRPTWVGFGRHHSTPIQANVITRSESTLPYNLSLLVPLYQSSCEIRRDTVDFLRHSITVFSLRQCVCVWQADGYVIMTPPNRSDRSSLWDKGLQPPGEGRQTVTSQAVLRGAITSPQCFSSQRTCEAQMNRRHARGNPAADLKWHLAATPDRMEHLARISSA